MTPPPPRHDAHSTDNAIEKAVAKLRGSGSGIPRSAANAILEFTTAKEQAVSPARRLAYLVKLRWLAEKMEDDFLVPTRETPAKFLRLFHDNQVWTQLTLRGVQMQFWKWRFESAGKEFPSWLKIEISKRNVNHKDESVVLTPEEIAKLADNTLNVRDRALVWCLYESGARIGELLALRIGDVEPTDYGGIRLRLPQGKTGRRTVPLFENAVPALMAWMNSHPRKDEKLEVLFCGLQVGERLGEPLVYQAVRKALLLAAGRAGIEKPVNPHNFRHSRATALSRDPRIAPAIFEATFGWTPGSPMAREYVHIAGKDVEEALARARGIEIVGDGAKKPTVRLPRICGRCQTKNDPAAKFCMTCAGPLDLDAVRQVEGAETEAKELAKLLSRPEVLKYLKTKLAASRS